MHCAHFSSLLTESSLIVARSLQGNGKPIYFLRRAFYWKIQPSQWIWKVAKIPSEFLLIQSWVKHTLIFELSYRLLSYWTLEIIFRVFSLFYKWRNWDLEKLKESPIFYWESYITFYRVFKIVVSMLYQDLHLILILFLPIAFGFSICVWLYSYVNSFWQIYYEGEKDE